MKKEKKEIKKETHPDVKAKVESKKWFYTDIVKKHFFHPKNFLKSEKAEKYKADGVGVVGSPACLAPSIQIYTNPILKPISEIKEGEEVLGHDSSYHPTERIFRVKYPATTLVKIRNYLGELIATTDHLVYAKQIPQRSVFRHNEYKRKIASSWVHAGDLKRGDISLYPLPSKIKPLKSIKFFSDKKKWDFRSQDLPKSVEIMPELLELFGYFVSEGSAREKEVKFAFNDKELHLAKRVKSLVKDIFELEAKICERKGIHRIDVNVYNVHLSRNFRELFGTSAETKHLPEFILFLKPELQKSLLKGLWLGDGYFATWRSQPRAGYTTVSRRLFNQIIFMLLRQRIIPSTFREKAKKVKGVNHKDSYRIHVGDMGSLERLADILGIKFKRSNSKRSEVRVWFEKNLVCLPIKKVEHIPYSGGRLLNFEVSDSHTYTTDAFLVHNCGDMMRMWIKVDKKNDRIKECKWETYGCGSAIASTSMLSVIVTENGGMKIDDALKIKPQEISARLGGLPNWKFHCSVLGDKALRAAINDYFRKTGQYKRIVEEGAKIVDKILKITDKDIEEAVLEGAKTLADVQKRTKVGVYDKSCIPEAEELIKFYREKYYGREE